MLDLKFLRDNLDEVERRLATRGGAIDLTDFRTFDQQRRDLLGEAETLKAERNQVSALIGKTKDKSQVQGEIARM
ncbi:MAG: serine--tRNA ligase, partial [Desulfuromonadales bacterium]|nr:serine--tRNA ligase [Desulfuromonadales bacterium]